MEDGLKGVIEPAERRRMGNIVRASCTALLGAVTFMVTSGLAPSPHAALAKVVDRNRHLRSYEAKLTLKFKESSFPYMSKTLSGTAYYKRPDHFVAVFSNVPREMRSFPQAYSAMMNIAAWPSQYVVSSAPSRKSGSIEEMGLRLKPRDPNSGLYYAMVFVDPHLWTVDEMDWYFKNMGFDVTQTFKTVGRALVLSGQNATIHVPFARVGVTTTVRDYETNVPIARNVFATKHS